VYGGEGEGSQPGKADPEASTIILSGWYFSNEIKKQMKMKMKMKMKMISTGAVVMVVYL